MTTVFDVITVTCFVAVALAFFIFTDRNPTILARLIVSVVLLAIANQAGNADLMLAGAALIVAALGIALYIIQKK